jgi:hypothetical protein
LSILVLVGAFLFAWPALSRHTPEGDIAKPEPFAVVQAGRQALAEGRFHLALRQLDEALALQTIEPSAANLPPRRELVQLQRQADLLKRLSQRTLEEILTQAALVRDPEEWKAQFKDYRGRTVIFDDVVRREEVRPVLATYVVQVRDEKALLALEDLTLFANLPLDPPRRLLFGARLAQCGREAGGQWVVRFEKDSAVLLTDPDAAGAILPGKLDADLQEVLARQKKWLNDLPAQKPAS